jgi:hypothetical protein
MYEIRSVAERDPADREDKNALINRQHHHQQYHDHRQNAWWEYSLPGHHGQARWYVDATAVGGKSVILADFHLSNFDPAFTPSSNKRKAQDYEPSSIKVKDTEFAWDAQGMAHMTEEVIKHVRRAQTRQQQYGEDVMISLAHAEAELEELVAMWSDRERVLYVSDNVFVETILEASFFAPMRKSCRHCNLVEKFGYKHREDLADIIFGPTESKLRQGDSNEYRK